MFTGTKIFPKRSRRRRKNRKIHRTTKTKQSPTRTKTPTKPNLTQTKTPTKQNPIQRPTTNRMPVPRKNNLKMPPPHPRRTKRRNKRSYSHATGHINSNKKVIFRIFQFEKAGVRRVFGFLLLNCKIEQFIIRCRFEITPLYFHQKM